MRRNANPDRVPYTMAKFVVFERVSESILKSMDKDLSDSAKTGVNLTSGLVAGFAAALISQPADTMLSKINKTSGAPGEGNTTRLIKIAKELGLRGSYAGIGARLFMVGGLTAGQFAIYGTCNSSSSPPTQLTKIQVTSSGCLAPSVVSRLASKWVEYIPGASMYCGTLEVYSRDGRL